MPKTHLQKPLVSRSSPAACLDLKARSCFETLILACAASSTRNNGQNYSRSLICSYLGLSLHEQAEDRRERCSSEVYKHGADGRSRHVRPGSSSSRPRPLLSVRTITSNSVGVTRGGDQLYSVCCVASELYCICTVLGLQEDGCDDACSRDISLECAHTRVCRVFFLLFLFCIAKKSHWKCIAYAVTVVLMVSYCQNSLTKLLLFSFVFIYCFISVW